ncbi:hypothetical protein J7T55_000907 [Diaporthe amygdali]|uniref:uncharacterized protein n=1 Tax=Phomopsis amygdali TaxID=1214568 RepID=UPI0022FDD53C|nr:uncharacterized protein J7T55_000907 [Diaporthe amygdali]KAJ0120054.1 hypothetical protein J7T55_000907 [Diaporthe amygdali]
MIGLQNAKVNVAIVVITWRLRFTSPNLEPRQGPGASEINVPKDEAEIAKDDETDSFWKTPIYLRLAGLT